MCGRYFIPDEYTDYVQIRETLAMSFADDVDTLNRVDRDVSPGMVAPTVVARDGDASVQPMRWGFDSSRGLVINARSETMRQKPMFSPLSDRQRCALPAAGYYEWRRSDRQRFSVRLHGSRLFFLAGLYRYGEAGLEYVVLTQPPTPTIERVHSRMPLILPDEAALRDWLAGKDAAFGMDERVVLRTDGNEQLQMLF